MLGNLQKFKDMYGAPSAMRLPRRSDGEFVTQSNEFRTIYKSMVSDYVDCFGKRPPRDLIIRKMVELGY